MEKNTRNTIVISAVVAIVASLLTFYAAQDILLAPSLRATEQIRENYASTDGTVSQINANACNRDGVCEVSSVVGESANFGSIGTTAIEISAEDGRVALGDYVKADLQEDETTTILLGNSAYEVSAQILNADQVRFVVNGQQTPTLSEGQTSFLMGGAFIGVLDILYSPSHGSLVVIELSKEHSFAIIEDDNVGFSALGEGSDGYVCANSVGKLYTSQTPCV